MSGAEIAKKIDADAVIFQTLEDLEAACAELSPRDPKTQKFEVGVFCGKYVTPVEDGYFDHLERVRGDRKKQKVQESARLAVVNGVADAEEIRIATMGVKVDQSGRVVPADSDDSTMAQLARGAANGDTKKADGRPQGAWRRGTQDISLHNFNDHAQ